MVFLGKTRSGIILACVASISGSCERGNAGNLLAKDACVCYKFVILFKGKFKYIPRARLSKVVGLFGEGGEGEFLG